jgi:hypothetical protein
VSYIVLILVLAARLASFLLNPRTVIGVSSMYAVGESNSELARRTVCGQAR